MSRFHKHSNFAEKFGPDWGTIGEFRLPFVTKRNIRNRDTPAAPLKNWELKPFSDANAPSAPLHDADKKAIRVRRARSH